MARHGNRNEQPRARSVRAVTAGRMHPQPITGEDRRLAGVQHLFAAHTGQEAGLQAAIDAHNKGLEVMPFMPGPNHWSK